MAPTDYTDRHIHVASIIHWNICRHFQVLVESRWYPHQPDRLGDGRHRGDVRYDHPQCKEDQSQPTGHLSQRQEARQTPVFSLISAVLPMATSVGSMLTSWQSISTCGWILIGISRMWKFQLTTTCSTYRKQCL